MSNIGGAREQLIFRKRWERFDDKEHLLWCLILVIFNLYRQLIKLDTQNQKVNLRLHFIGLKIGFLLKSAIFVLKCLLECVSDFNIFLFVKQVQRLVRWKFFARYENCRKKISPWNLPMKFRPNFWQYFDDISPYFHAEWSIYISKWSAWVALQKTYWLFFIKKIFQNFENLKIFRKFWKKKFFEICFFQ